MKDWFIKHKNKLLKINGGVGFVNYINDDYLSFDFGENGNITKIKLEDIHQMEVIYID